MRGKNVAFKILTLILIVGLRAGATEVENLSADYQKAKQQITQSDVLQRQVLSSLYGLNRKLKKIVYKRARREEEKFMLQDSTKKLAISVLALEEATKTQKIKLRERLVAIYKLGGQGVARVLFSATSSAQLERNLKTLGLIAKHDFEIIDDYADSVRELERKKFYFTNRLDRISKLETEISEEEKTLQAQNSEKSKLLNQIKATQKFSFKKLNDLKSKTENFGFNEDTGALDPLYRPSFFERKGEIPPPVKGKITKDYGIVKLENDSTSWAYKGVFISVPQKTPVRSVFDGTVAFIGQIQGFGRTIIVDHGDHYYTVYGDNSAISVQVGEEVKQNQIISNSGVDQEDEASGLYFEIRHFSEPNDPKLWLKGITI